MRAGRPETVVEIVDFAASRYAGSTFLVEGERALSFEQTRDAARSAAAAFIAAGVEPGERVAIWAPNSIDWVIACLGLQYVGAVLVPINTRYRGPEAAYVLAKSEAVMLVTTTDFLHADYVALLRDTGSELPALRHTVVLSGAVPPAARSWHDFVAAGSHVGEEAVEPRARAVRPDDVSDVVFTSGTTGHPKGVLLGHGQTVRLVHLWNEMLGLSPADRYVVLNPFFHVFGTKYGWLCALLAGVTAYPLAVFDPRSLMDLIEREQITFVPGQPTIFASLLALPDLERYDRSHLRLAVVGSTAIPPQLVRDMHDVLGFRHVVSGYGLTETCGEVTLCRFDDDIETVAHTVGRPLDGVEVRVVDAEDAAVPAGSDGEILVRGFNVMRGYLGEPEATAAVLDPDGWLRTGDWGHLDEAGSLSITGRVKDIVIVGGFNVAPPEVESALLLHPGIRDAAVIGVPDERLGEVTAAFIVGEDGASPTQDEVVAWCRERLANFKVPRAVWFVSALPYNAIGKIQKNELRDRAAAGDTSW